jgi:hypothetical protein
VRLPAPESHVRFGQKGIQLVSAVLSWAASGQKRREKVKAGRSLTNRAAKAKNDKKSA